MTIDCKTYRSEGLPNGTVRLYIDEPTTVVAPAAPEPDELMTKADTALYLGKSPRTITNYMHRTKNPIPHFFPGGHPRFRKSAVDAWSTKAPVSTKATIARAIF